LPQKTHAQWRKDGQNSPRSGYWGALKSKS
jgi:hypothetical protein